MSDQSTSISRFFGPVLTSCIALFSVLVTPDFASAANAIDTASGLFVPSFRGDANTTFFGWGPISGFSGPYGFDGGTDNELMESPAPNINPTAGAVLDQNNTIDILASSN